MRNANAAPQNKHGRVHWFTVLPIPRNDTVEALGFFPKVAGKTTVPASGPMALL